MKTPTLPDFSEIIGEKPSLDNFLDKPLEEESFLVKPADRDSHEFGEFVSEANFDDVSRTIHEEGKSEIAVEGPSALEIRKGTIITTECEENKPDTKPIRPRKGGLQRKGALKRK